MNVDPTLLQRMEWKVYSNFQAIPVQKRFWYSSLDVKQHHFLGLFGKTAWRFAPENYLPRVSFRFLEQGMNLRIVKYSSHCRWDLFSQENLSWVYCTGICVLVFLYWYLCTSNCTVYCVFALCTSISLPVNTLCSV